MHKINYKLLFVVLILVVFGLLMVYSASNIVALYKFNDKAYFLKRQLIFAVIGIALMFFIININLEILYIYHRIDITRTSFNTRNWCCKRWC